MYWKIIDLWIKEDLLYSVYRENGESTLFSQDFLEKIFCLTFIYMESSFIWKDFCLTFIYIINQKSEFSKY